ncbi:MAG TPA: glycosyltransferase family 9 protein [Bryobacteraceae bacterium]|nr:glycosyltransferase family 9 protein [Bryobacteraceae bacterium]
MSVIERIPAGARVLIVRIRSMGDCVLTTPAIRILADARPDVQIGVVVEPRFRAIFEGNPAISAILEPSLIEVSRWRPFLCLNFHGGRRSQILTLASGASIRAGFGHHRGAGLYHQRIPRAQEILGEERPVHTAEHLASAMFYLGCPRRAIPRAQLYASPGAPRRPYAVIHPVAAAPYKTWGPGGFVAAAKHVRERHGLDPVFIGGAEDDMSAFRDFECVSGAPLEAIKSLVSGASLFVGNDSGPAHIAAAFDVPLMVLFGRVEHQTTWAPWQASAARTLVDGRGISAIEVEQVIAAIDDLRGSSTAPRKGAIPGSL